MPRKTIAKIAEDASVLHIINCIDVVIKDLKYVCIYTSGFTPISSSSCSSSGSSSTEFGVGDTNPVSRAPITGALKSDKGLSVVG